MKAVLPVLVAAEETEVVEEVVIELKPPAFLIKDVEFKVIIDRCAVIRNKVLIVGRVIVNVLFKTFQIVEEVFPVPAEIVCGDVRHCTAILPFTAGVPVPGAKPGDVCRIVCAEVEGQLVEILEKKKVLLPEVEEEHHKHHAKRVIELIEKIRIVFAILIQFEVLREEEVLVQGVVRKQLRPAFAFPTRV